MTSKAYVDHFALAVRRDKRRKNRKNEKCRNDNEPDQRKAVSDQSPPRIAPQTRLMTGGASASIASVPGPATTASAGSAVRSRG